jgi:NADPH:quinone reductase
MMPSEMKSWWMQVNDGTATLTLRDTALPQPGPHQIQVRMRAASLNRGEFILAHGLHSKGSGVKAIGMEAAGEVTACGAAVTQFKPGDKVMGRCPAAFAEMVVMDEREAMGIPANLNWQEAASIPLVFLVVYDMLILQGKLKANDWLLVAGVSSGVGVGALQMAKALGANVIGTSGSHAKLERLKGLGLDVGICSRKPDFREAVMQATGGKGVNLVVNAVGGSVFAECVSTMAFEGRLATVGYVDGVMGGAMDIEALHAKRLTLFGVSNKLRSADQKAQSLPAFKAEILPLIAQGKFKPLVDKAFAFEQLDEAKAFMDANQQVGKVVVNGPV